MSSLSPPSTYLSPSDLLNTETREEAPCQPSEDPHVQVPLPDSPLNPDDEVPLPNAPSSAYFHSPLPDHHIRLVELLPAGERDETISCRITVHREGHCPPYAALSYKWGECSDGTHTIFVNGIPFVVRSNLWLFLKRIREMPPTQRDQFLWADALCIDQENVPERNHQVGIMDRIYKNAIRALAWLGAGEQYSDMAMERDEFGVHSRRRKNILDHFDRHHPLWKALYEVTKRPYWRRTWIIQEITLSREVLLLCGQQTMSWEQLRDLMANAIQSMDENARAAIAGMVMALDKERRRRFRLIANHKSGALVGMVGLESAMDRFEGSECTDLRDKVYGLLGLVRAPLEPDYAKSLIELYEELMTKYRIDLQHKRNNDGTTSQLLHFGRLLLRTLRLDITESEVRGRGDNSDIMFQSAGTIIGRVLELEPRARNAMADDYCLFENWTSHTASGGQSDWLPSAWSHYTMCMERLKEILGRHLDDSLCLVDFADFTNAVPICNTTIMDFSIRYSPKTYPAIPIREKATAGVSKPLFNFIYSLGYVGVTDIGVQAGDLICSCWSISPTYALILRESPSGPRPIGRAIIPIVPYKSAKSSMGVEEMCGYKKIGSPKMEVSFDAISLLALVLLPFP